MGTPASILKKSLQHLYLGCADARVQEHLLSAASDLSNLWIGHASPAAQIFQPTRLKRLHCNLQSFFPCDKQVDFKSHPLFAHLTHLDISDAFSDALLDGLRLIPNLTHLAFWKRPWALNAPRILRECPALRLIVYQAYSGGVVEIKGYPTLHGLESDTRFVQMLYKEQVKDWHMGALTGDDFWSRAEEFNGKRRSGEIHLRMYVIVNDPHRAQV
ncbi:hypothetical protein FB45DRAFT_1129486 [Roridomyces roridus]|uniref:Uncharacterized protein n=1 Tax=Roridomyces roridus TaxID=1738132 RepID=A0AAD7F886_9AGAR|nr:hypothetical protein FB45DRAFT_1129486 [Roridomyces roridus]